MKMLAAYQACAAWNSQLPKKEQILCVSNMPCKQGSKRHTFHDTRAEEDKLADCVHLSYWGITRMNFRKTSNTNGNMYTA
jgi:hypothetical protein